MVLGSILQLSRICGLLAGALILVAPAQASNAGIGSISAVLAVPNGVVMFNQSGTRTAVPSCAASNPTRWVIDSTQPGGPAMVSLMLSAYATNRPVVIFGTGTCSTIQSDTETIAYFGTQ